METTVTTGKNYGILWKWKEAEYQEGKKPNRIYGSYATSLDPGDRIFIWATSGGELYLLGACVIGVPSGDRVNATSQYGYFKRIPLGKLKKDLRFESTRDRLDLKSPLGGQLQARRKLTPETVNLLEDLLADNSPKQELHVFEAQEGTPKTFELSKRERDPNLRQMLLKERGKKCEICAFDFTERYDKSAAECVEVHHLKPLSKAGPGGIKTSLHDLLVVCPNCHRALHRFPDVGDWQGFKEQYGL